MIVDDRYDRWDRWITENIRLLRSSQLLKFDFHVVAGIIQIAGHIRSLWSSWSLRMLCYGFHMIAEIVTIVMIVAVTAMVVSINFLGLLTIVHDRYDRRDRLILSQRPWSLQSLAVAGIVGARWQNENLVSIWLLRSLNTLLVIPAIAGDRSWSLGLLVNCSAIVMIIWKPNFHFASDHQWSQWLPMIATITMAGIESESMWTIVSNRKRLMETTSAVTAAIVMIVTIPAIIWKP